MFVIFLFKVKRFFLTEAHGRKTKHVIVANAAIHG